MPSTKQNGMQLLRIFIACPGDVTPEKERVFKIADSLQPVAKAAGFLLEVKEWRQVLPDMGRPQQVIFDQIQAETWDVFVGVLWLRFGAPSGGIDPRTGQSDESGTYEEFRVAYDLWKQTGRPRILFYQCRRASEDPYAVDEEQFGKVRAFFKQFEVGGEHQGITKPYKTIEEFADFLRTHLQELLLAKLPSARRKAVARSKEGRPDVDVEVYRTSILNEYRNLRLETLKADQTYYVDIELRSVFIPQDVRDCQRWMPEALGVPKQLASGESGEDETFKLTGIRHVEEFRQQEATSIFKVLRDVDKPHIVILGDPGSGKSSFSRVVLLNWAADPTSTPNVPFIIELRRYHRESAKEDFLVYLARNESIRYNPPLAALQKRLESGTATVLFDGLDEVFDPRHRVDVARRVLKLAQKYPKGHFVVTSRLVGFPPRLLRDAGFHHWLIQDFDKEKIEQFIDRWCAVAVRDDRDSQLVRTRIRSAVQVGSIRELAGNPLLLTMMAMLARQSDLPRDQITLYQECSKLLLELWEANKVLERDQQLRDVRIDWRDKHDLLCRLAWYLQNSGAGVRGNLIHRQKLEEIMNVSFGHIAEARQRRVVIGLVIDQLRERNFILSHVGNEYYAFVHRGFLEYYCAEEIKRICSSGDEPPADIAVGIFAKHADEDSWKEVLILASGNLPPKVADAALVAATQQADDKNNRPVRMGLAALGRSRDLSALPSAQSVLREYVENHLDHYSMAFQLFEFWPDERAVEKTMAFLRGPRTEWEHIILGSVLRLRADRDTFALAQALLDRSESALPAAYIIDDLFRYFPESTDLSRIVNTLAKRSDASEILMYAVDFSAGVRHRDAMIQSFVEAGIKPLLPKEH
jgi:NACHT domain-containing protein